MRGAIDESVGGVRPDHVGETRPLVAETVGGDPQRGLVPQRETHGRVPCSFGALAGWAVVSGPAIVTSRPFHRTSMQPSGRIHESEPSATARPHGDADDGRRSFAVRRRNGHHAHAGHDRAAPHPGLGGGQQLRSLTLDVGVDRH